MSSAVKNLVKTCNSCPVTAQPQIKYESLKMSEISKNPWEVPVINLKDLFPAAEHLLILTDYRF